MSEFAPGKRVKIIFSTWNLAGIQGDFGTILRPGETYDWIVLVEFPGAQPEEEGCNESILELVEDAPTDTPAPIAATTVGAGRKPTYEELQAENALMAGRIEDLTGELERERAALEPFESLWVEYNVYQSKLKGNGLFFDFLVQECDPSEIMGAVKNAAGMANDRDHVEVSNK